MLFNSYGFIFFFLPITLFLFFFTAKYSRQVALGILFLASMVFYGWCNYHYALLLLFSIIVNFYIGKYIIDAHRKRVAQHILLGGIIFNLGLLGYFKYTDFFIENMNLAFHMRLHLLNIILPIGISFFTFTQIAFLVDSYRGLVQKYPFLNYALFVTYFPHLIAGPIIHHKEVMPQFNKNRTFQFNYRNFVLGLTLFSIGLFKKSILADNLSSYVGPIFDAHGVYISWIDAWTAALSYTLELYFDFSGYSDMAIGLSLFVGVKLPVNFYSPYKSVSIIEFWRRWNMTLSRFLRDYLYISLGGNRKGSIRRYVNLLATMVLGGLWHGASWTFVLWGSLHGFYLCINHGWSALKRYVGIYSSGGILVTTLSRLMTFMAVLIAWVFFRAPDVSKACAILHAMFFEKIMLPTYWHLPISVSLLLQQLHVGFSTDSVLVSHDAIMLFLLSSIIIWFLPNSYQLLKRYKPALLWGHEFSTHTSKKRALVWRPSLVWNFFISFLFVFGVINIQASSVFLYFRF